MQQQADRAGSWHARGVCGSLWVAVAVIAGSGVLTSRCQSPTPSASFVTLRFGADPPRTDTISSPSSGMACVLRPELRGARGLTVRTGVGEAGVEARSCTCPAAHA